MQTVSVPNQSPMKDKFKQKVLSFLSIVDSEISVDYEESKQLELEVKRIKEEIKELEKKKMALIKKPIFMSLNDLRINSDLNSLKERSLVNLSKDMDIAIEEYYKLLENE